MKRFQLKYGDGRAKGLFGRRRRVRIKDEVDVIILILNIFHAADIFIFLCRLFHKHVFLSPVVFIVLAV